MPPGSAPLLAARAGQLGATGPRRALVGRWSGVLAESRRPVSARRLGVPPCRTRVLAAQGEAHAMRRALSAPSPTPTRGLAMATVVPATGPGPSSTPGAPPISGQPWAR